MARESAVNTMFDSFVSALNTRDKARCIQLVKDALDTKSISIPELYEGVLARSLHEIATNEKEQKIAIWEEHIQSAIVRSALEITYPYIMNLTTKDDNRPQPAALVFCQEEEYHELGARMATDFLTLLGFDALFIGANTPAEEALAAVVTIRPQLVCVSVTNFFHLTRLQSLINAMRAHIARGDVPPFTIVAGGYAVKYTPGVSAQLTPDYFASCYHDLAKIREAMV